MQNTFDVKQHGIVKWFNNTKGYGFIVDDLGHEIFVHFRGIASDGYKSLTSGEDVSFIKEKSAKGYSALQVKTYR